MCSVVALVVVCVAGVAQSPDDAVRKEITRLQTFASAQSVADEDWKDMQPMVQRYLALADQALKAGHVYFAVEELGKANASAAAYQFSKQSPEILKQGMAGFEKEWKQASVKLAALDTEAKTRKWTGAPAAVRAVAESAQGQGPVLVEAAHAYATVTNPEAGYFYLGEAKADEEFARLVHGFGLKGRGTPLGARSILPEIEKLQEKINASFVPPRSIEKHSDFIRLNSTLKLAGELDRAQLYCGTLYQYLQAVVQYELLEAKEVDASTQAEVRAAIAAARKKVEASRRDDSIAQMFVERAETLIANKAGKEASAEEWKNAVVVVQEAIPSYYEALESHAPVPRQQKDAVTVTLVRWPYT
jgi:hypothetical protein